MIRRGKILEIQYISAMQDCSLLIEFDANIGIIKCTALVENIFLEHEIESISPNEIECYIEDDDSIVVRKEQTYDFKLSACFVSYCTKIDSIEYTIIQHDSTKGTVHFEGRVHQKIDGDFICKIDKLEEFIYVDYESNIDELEIGELIKFKGELRVEPRKALVYSQHNL